MKKLLVINLEISVFTHKVMIPMNNGTKGAKTKGTTSNAQIEGLPEILDFDEESSVHPLWEKVISGKESDRFHIDPKKLRSKQKSQYELLTTRRCPVCREFLEIENIGGDLKDVIFTCSDCDFARAETISDEISELLVHQHESILEHGCIHCENELTYVVNESRSKDSDSSEGSDSTSGLSSDLFWCSNCEKIDHLFYANKRDK